MECRLDVITTARPRCSPRATEYATENVTEIPKVPKLLATRETTGYGTESANFVILLTLLRVTNNVVGGGDFLELFFRAWVRIGVELLRQLAIGASDLLVGGSLRHSEDLIEVLFKPLALGH